MASSATLALNSAVKRLRVFMSDGPSRRWTHFSSLPQRPAPALLSMRPALAARPEETLELFVDLVALALSIHVAHRYGDVAAFPQQSGGGLAPWQERRAKELLDAHIGGG